MMRRDGFLFDGQ